MLDTLSSMALLLVFFYVGHRRGHITGLREGYDNASRELLMAKDPEAWDKARYLQVEKKQREEGATTRIVRAQKE